jgi:hypothetical protein
MLRREPTRRVVVEHHDSWEIGLRGLEVLVNNNDHAYHTRKIWPGHGWRITVCVGTATLPALLIPDRGTVTGTQVHSYTR